MVYSDLTFVKKLLPRAVANINIQRNGARVNEFCIELHRAADLGVRRQKRASAAEIQYGVSNAPNGLITWL
jgi:hypothetical protein